MTAKITEYVVGFAFDRYQEKVKLILKDRPDWQKGKLNGIGGHIQQGETPFNAMRREFIEEGNLIIHDWKNFAILNGNDFVVHFFRSNVDVFDSIESMTDEKIYTACVNCLPSNVLDNLRWLIPMAHLSQQDDWPLLIYERTNSD